MNSLYGLALRHFTEPTLPIEQRVSNLKEALYQLYDEYYRLGPDSVFNPDAITRGWNKFYLEMYHSEYRKILYIMRAMQRSSDQHCDCVLCTRTAPPRVYSPDPRIYPLDVPGFSQPGQRVEPNSYVFPDRQTSQVRDNVVTSQQSTPSSSLMQLANIIEENLPSILMEPMFTPDRPSSSPPPIIPLPPEENTISAREHKLEPI